MLYPSDGYSSLFFFFFKKPVVVLGQEWFIIIPNFLTYIVMKLENWELGIEV